MIASPAPQFACDGMTGGNSIQLRMGKKRKKGHSTFGDSQGGT
jgi:hypothetical protein